MTESSKPQPVEEKAKPFRLVKYFSFASLTVIFIGTLVLSMLNTHWARTLLDKKSEDYAFLLLENLNHQILQQFIIAVYKKYGTAPQLRNKEQYALLDNVVRETLHGFNVDHVNIYDRHDRILYSFDERMVGKTNIGGTGYQKAVSGESSSELIQRGNFWEILLGFPKASRITTFAPLRAEKSLTGEYGPVLGVIEIVQDLSKDYKSIFSVQILVIITCTLVMGALFLVLLFVVKRGEGIIQKRTLERLKLKEQLNRAERLSSLGEMAAGISHEIRNPLGIIRSSGELLKKKIAAFDPSNSIPDIIIEESTRLNNIITDFFNFAKPKSPNLVPCRIEEIVNKNLKFLGAQIEEQGYIVETHYSNFLPEIIADADMLYQAFLNILINAMQAMPGGGKIYVEIGVGNNSVILFFEDEGEGIAADKVEKIWNPFFTTKVKGTGLGLGIVKNIMEAHKGSVTIGNRHPLNGARVKIELPISQ